MTLQGHNSGITVVNIGHDKSCAVTYSNDKTLRVWNTDVRYKDRENTKCVCVLEQEQLNNEFDCEVKITALSVRRTREGVIYLGIGDSRGCIKIMNVNEKKFAEVTFNHQAGKISSLEFWQKGDQLILMSSGQDGRLIFWKVGKE